MIVNVVDDFLRVLLVVVLDLQEVARMVLVPEDLCRLKWIFVLCCGRLLKFGSLHLLGLMLHVGKMDVRVQGLTA